MLGDCWFQSGLIDILNKKGQDPIRKIMRDNLDGTVSVKLNVPKIVEAEDKKEIQWQPRIYNVEKSIPTLSRGGVTPYNFSRALWVHMIQKAMVKGDIANKCAYVEIIKGLTEKILPFPRSIIGTNSYKLKNLSKEQFSEKLAKTLHSKIDKKTKKDNSGADNQGILDSLSSQEISKDIKKVKKIFEEVKKKKILNKTKLNRILNLMESEKVYEKRNTTNKVRSYSNIEGGYQWYVTGPILGKMSSTEKTKNLKYNSCNAAFTASLDTMNGSTKDLGKTADAIYDAVSEQLGADELGIDYDREENGKQKLDNVLYAIGVEKPNEFLELYKTDEKQAVQVLEALFFFNNIKKKLSSNDENLISVTFDLKSEKAAGKGISGGEKSSSSGLVERHQYSICDATIENGIRYIWLINPWSTRDGVEYDENGRLKKEGGKQYFRKGKSIYDNNNKDGRFKIKAIDMYPFIRLLQFEDS